MSMATSKSLYCVKLNDGEETNHFDGIWRDDTGSLVKIMPQISITFQWPQVLCKPPLLVFYRYFICATTKSICSHCVVLAVLHYKESI